MSIILAIKTQRCAVVAADSQCGWSTGETDAPYDRTFHIDSVIGAYTGLSEFSGLDTKQHIANALYAKNLGPRDALEVLETQLRPILEAVTEEDIAFEKRGLEIIVASREEIALLKFWPDPQSRQIETLHRLNQTWLVAGTSPARHHAAVLLSKQRGLSSFTKNPTLKIAQEIAEAAIAACHERALRSGEAHCVLPVSLRTV